MSTESFDPRTPVLVGVGTAVRPVDADPEAEEVEPLDLMVEATAAALADSGVAAPLVERIGSVAVPVGNWSYADPARLVADAVGAPGASTVRVEIGVAQSTPIRVAASRIAAGELDAAIVVGGEAKASQQRAARRGVTPVETDDRGAAPDECWSPEGEFMAQAEVDAGLWDPVAQYACIEEALGHAEGLDREAHLDEVAELWARMNRVARTNPDAAFPAARDEAFLREAGPGNRLLASPYAKWHSTQWGVDQAAALVLCSAGLVGELRIDPQRCVWPVALVDSSHALSMTRRVELHRWPAMRVLGEAAGSHAGVVPGDVDHVELYSCFPAAVRVQQRELGLAPDGTPTLTGGMAFAGGPFNNFTYQAVAAVARALRDAPGTTGLVTTVSGLLTKAGLGLWCGPDHDLAGTEPLLEDLGERAGAATASCDVTAQHRGPARVVTHTVLPDAAGAPAKAFVVAQIDQATRWVGTSEQPALVAAALAGALIGEDVAVDGDRCRR